MQWLQQLIDGLLAWSASVPVEVFTFVGAFLEEVIAPIPSPLILTTAGTIAKAAGHAWVFLLWLSLIGAVSKTLGAWIVYAIADKGEDFILKYFGKFLGISSDDIRNLEKSLRGKMRQDVSLFVLRSLPIVSSSLLSVLCGVLKIEIRLYLVTTFLGTLIRNLFFLVLGYMGVEAYQSLIGGVDTLETVTKILMLLGVAGVIGWMYWRRWKKK
jgi:membrane protein DedA with SNARE-associated domain